MHLASLGAEIIPFALWFLSGGDPHNPDTLHRKVPDVDMLNDVERSAFDYHVGILRSLGMTYKRKENQNSGAEYSYSNSMLDELSLSPAVDSLVQYNVDFNVTSQRPILPFEMKEMLSQEARLEDMRERESSVGGNAATMSVMTSPQAIPKSGKIFAAKSPQGRGKKRAGGGVEGGEGEEEGDSDDGSHIISPNEKRSKPNSPASKAADMASPPPKLTFLGVNAAKVKAAAKARRAASIGFTVSTNSKNKPQKMSFTGSGAKLDEVIKYQYQKGFTQAIKVGVKLGDLM